MAAEAVSVLIAYQANITIQMNSAEGNALLCRADRSNISKSLSSSLLRQAMIDGRGARGCCTDVGYVESGRTWRCWVEPGGYKKGAASSFPFLCSATSGPLTICCVTPAWHCARPATTRPGAKGAHAVVLGFLAPTYSVHRRSPSRQGPRKRTRYLEASIHNVHHIPGLSKKRVGFRGSPAITA